MTPSLLALKGVVKTYGAVEAVRGVDLDIHEGEVLALCGDNGAGKSSLVKIIAGAQEPSAGEIRFRGEVARFVSPQDALNRGIATIYQDLAVAPRLSIAENVFLGSEPTRGLLGLPFPRFLDKGRMAREARGYLERLGIAISDMSTPVERLSGGQRQAVALSRALRWDARLVVMDEPTAALGVAETAQVLALIRRFAAEGRTVLLVSHNMVDVAGVATRVAILKAGLKVIDRAIEGLSPTDLGRMVMSGEDHVGRGAVSGSP